MEKLILEIVAEGMHQRWCEGTCGLRWNLCNDVQIDLQEIESGLAALQAAGFDLYRPDECVEAALTSLSLNLGQPKRLGFEVVSMLGVPMPPSLSPGEDSPRYRLVPVGGDS